MRRGRSDDTVSLLASGKVQLRGLLAGASNYTFLAEVVDGGRCALAVYKPREGEAPLWDFPDGTLCLREVAAFEVSEALGWGLVPPTVLRGGPHGVGSVQLFVGHDPAENYFTLLPAHPEELRRVAAFDLVVNNADRKAGHCVRERATGRIRVIDHGVSFHTEPKLRTVIWDFAGEEIPAEILADLEPLRGLLAGGEVATGIGAFLAPAEIDALRRRVEQLISVPVFPEPGSRRHLPWPPV